MRRSKANLVVAVDLSGREEELYPLLERQARLYTMGDSSSLPLETVQALLRSIRYCIETHLSLHGGNPSRPLAPLFAAGQRDVWRLTEESKALHTQAVRVDPGYGSIACRDTLDAVGGFFRVYDLRFFAHDIPCMIDYPLAQPVPEALEGVRFIGEYLRRLILESRFCGCMEPARAVWVLRRHHPEYRALVRNLFEPLFAHALGQAVLHGRADPPAALDAQGCERLYHRFHPWDSGRAEALLREAVHRLCAGLRLWDTAMRNYLLDTAASLLPLLQAASVEGYANLFTAL